MLALDKTAILQLISGLKEGRGLLFSTMSILIDFVHRISAMEMRRFPLIVQGRAIMEGGLLLNLKARERLAPLMQGLY